MNVLLSLLQGNSSNQSFFKEGTFLPRLAGFLDRCQDTEEVGWSRQKTTNITLMFQVRGGEGKGEKGREEGRGREGEGEERGVKGRDEEREGVRGGEGTERKGTEGRGGFSLLVYIY